MLITAFLSAISLAGFPVPDIFGFVILLLYALYITEEHWYVSLYWVTVLAILFYSTVNLSIHIFMTLPNLSYSALMEDGYGRFLFIISTNALLFLIVFSASKIKREYTKLAWPVLLLFLLMNGSIFAVEEALYSLQMEFEQNELMISPMFLLAYSGLFLCVFLSIHLYNRMTRSAAHEGYYKAEISALSQQKQHQQEIERMYNSFCAQRHDFKHQVELLDEMVRTGNNREAEVYLEAYQEKNADQRQFITGSTAMDALLTAKYLTMSKLGISFKFTPYPLQQTPVSITDFCAVVGNLLDNAIEGVQRLSAPASAEIQLSFSRTWDMFYIHCTNPCNTATIKKSAGFWRSSKDLDGRSGLHAIGIRSIEKIVEQAEGR
ncbi:MAG: GHKL domain-containing protein, partial [Clostridia bacterium]